MKQFQNNKKSKSIALRLVIDGVLWVILTILAERFISTYFWGSALENQLTNAWSDFFMSSIARNRIFQEQLTTLGFLPLYLSWGIRIGIAQQIILFRHGETSGRWFVFTTLAYAAGSILGNDIGFLLRANSPNAQQDYANFLLASFVVVIISSTIIGIIQWLVLRRIVKKAWPWIFIVIASHITNFVIVRAASVQIPWLDGSITGVGIVILLWINYTRQLAEKEI